MTTTIRTRFAAGETDSRCSLTYVDETTGNPITRVFFAPASGGYVQENWAQPHQVCARLQGSGHTLVWSPSQDGPLVNLIRREWKAWQAAERRQWGV